MFITNCLSDQPAVAPLSPAGTWGSRARSAARPVTLSMPAQHTRVWGACASTTGAQEPGVGGATASHTSCS